MWPLLKMMTSKRKETNSLLEDGWQVVKLLLKPYSRFSNPLAISGIFHQLFIESSEAEGKDK